jgi:hypothetical protein
MQRWQLAQNGNQWIRRRTSTADTTNCYQATQTTSQGKNQENQKNIVSRGKKAQKRSHEGCRSKKVGKQQCSATNYLVTNKFQPHNFSALCKMEQESGDTLVLWT